MKRILGILTVAALAAVGCARKVEAPAASTVRGLATVTVERREAASEVEVEGAVVGRTESALASRLAAPVVEVRAVPGRTVRAGEVLVRLEQREADGAVEGARAEAAAADSALVLRARTSPDSKGSRGKGAAATLELERARQAEAMAPPRGPRRRPRSDAQRPIAPRPSSSLRSTRWSSRRSFRPGTSRPGRPSGTAGFGRRTARRGGARRAGGSAARRLERKWPSWSVARWSPAGSWKSPGRSIRQRDAARCGWTSRAASSRQSGPSYACGWPGQRDAPARARRRHRRARRARARLGGRVGNTVALRYVRTGAHAKGGLVEIRSGLEAGERVVLDPPADLEAGTRVTS